ncbi:hypothetical protein N431DRAFT_439694 [Stipitochalara longipes BDJ]|nr:hypothetical protein N431DRAFT_439694 [Stipitochalara longipes BDJ]
MSPTEPSPPPVDPTPPPNKRRKTQLACHPCRARKTGCDGHRPHCSACVMRGWQDRCGYQEKEIQAFASTPAPTLLDLDRRLRKLEKNQQGQTAAPIISSTTQENILSDFTISSRGRHDGIRQDEFPEDRCQSVEYVPVDGVPSGASNSSFVQQVASVVGPHFEDADKTGSGSGGSSLSTNVFSVNNLVLPPRNLADSVMKCYEDLFQPVYPVLHYPTFTAAYDQLWRPASIVASNHNARRDVIFYSTLNIVLALGCQRNEALPEADREELASEFFKRSVRQVSLDDLGPPSLQIVQLLLLRGFFLLYTPDVDRCWSTVGAALRVAQAVGLQSASTTAAANQLDREMRRRVWHACVLLDWLTCISFERPPTLSRDSPISLPALIDDEYLSETGEGQQPPNLPSRLELFVYGLRLNNIREKLPMHKAQNVQTGKRTFSGQDIGTTLQLMTEIDRFVDTLPYHLRADHSSLEHTRSVLPAAGSDNRFELQARVLKARIMYARLSILRPFIVAEANRCISAAADDRRRSNASTNVTSKLYEDLCNLCVTIAHDTIEELHARLFTVYRSSPWHTLYFTFAAASVLVAATLCPSLEVDLDQDPCKASWDKALQIFAFHKAHVASAEKGIEALHKFRNYIVSRGATNQVMPRTPVTSEVESATVSREDSVGHQTLPELGDFVMPMDESWFSQDFCFDEGLIEWQ